MFIALQSPPPLTSAALSKQTVRQWRLCNLVRYFRNSLLRVPAEHQLNSATIGRQLKCIEQAQSAS